MSMLEKKKASEQRQTDNEAQIIDDLIQTIIRISKKRHPHGKILRFNQPKSLGCLDADFHVDDNQDERLKQGLFSRPGHYPATLRFANAKNFDDRKKDFRGLSIKVSGIEGESLWGESGIQDFILNSHPVLFASSAGEFLEFTRAMEKGRIGLFLFFLIPSHWKALWIIFKGRKKISNPFAIRYWSTTPYQFGTDQPVAVKYSVRPAALNNFVDSSENSENKLSEVMKRQLEQGPVILEFMVQFQNTAADMPIEDASALWDENDSPFHKVASITINNQAFDSEQSKLSCEQISFNPWQCLPEHKPLGGINRARKKVYAELSAYRLNKK